jgi:hypothetical protein
MPFLLFRAFYTNLFSGPVSGGKVMNIFQIKGTHLNNASTTPVYFSKKTSFGSLSELVQSWIKDKENRIALLRLNSPPLQLELIEWAPGRFSSATEDLIRGLMSKEGFPNDYKDRVNYLLDCLNELKRRYRLQPETTFDAIVKHLDPDNMEEFILRETFTALGDLDENAFCKLAVEKFWKVKVETQRQIVDSLYSHMIKEPYREFWRRLAGSEDKALKSTAENALKQIKQ